MKVMCTAEGKQDSEYPVKFGETYTVARMVEWWEVAGPEDREYYQLEEMPIGIAYWAALFSPLSDIEEKELIPEETTAS